MNEDILKAIHQELVAIRQLLSESRQPQARNAPARPAASPAVAPSGDAPPPQPTEIIANPGDVQVHFGKNTGIPLSKLSERSLAWYAQEPAPRLDSSGNPYPPRPEDLALRNAARTLWHQNKGTLVTAGASGLAGASSPTSAPPSDTDEMPF